MIFIKIQSELVFNSRDFAPQKIHIFLETTTFLALAVETSCRHHFPSKLATRSKISTVRLRIFQYQSKTYQTLTSLVNIQAYLIAKQLLSYFQNDYMQYTFFDNRVPI